MQELLQKIAEYFDFLKVLDAMHFKIAGNAPSRWVIALIMSALVVIVLKLIYTFINQRLVKLAAKTDNYLDDVLAETFGATKSISLILLGAYAGSGLLDLGRAHDTITHIMVIVSFLQVGVWMSTLLCSLLNQWHTSRNGDASVGTALVAFRFLGRVIIWSIVLLLILDNLGIKVVSLLAGLGVGGIAVALAVQRVLGDLLASISIVLDKPFELGDTIAVGDQTGAVEHVGLKTTRLRATSGEQLIVSNSDLLNSRIRNFKRMNERRQIWTIGVTYEASPEKLEQIPVWIKDIIGATENLRFERSHLQKLGDSAIVFETIYWVTTPDMLTFMDAQQKINLELVKKFAAEGVDFAYPTQTLHIAPRG